MGRKQRAAEQIADKLNLERSAVKASVDGRITGLELRPGTYVTTGRGVMALIDGDTQQIQILRDWGGGQSLLPVQSGFWNYLRLKIVRLSHFEG